MTSDNPGKNRGSLPDAHWQEDTAQTTSPVSTTQVRDGPAGRLRLSDLPLHPPNSGAMAGRDHRFTEDSQLRLGSALQQDFDNTPRSEVPPRLLASQREGDIDNRLRHPLVPPTLEVMTPHASEALAAASRAAGGHGPEPDYFTQTMEPLRRPSLASAHSLSTSDATAAAPTSTTIDHRALALSMPATTTSTPSLLFGPGRPVAQTMVSNISIESAVSTATITPANSTPAVASGRPVFPNQSYAALHDQQYPPPYIPSSRRQGLHSSPIHTFSSTIASRHTGGSNARVAGVPGGASSVVGSASGAATTVATAASSSGPLPPSATNHPYPSQPGLFSSGPTSSTPPLDSAGSEARGAYPSPFLHHTHTHVPKETHIADVDVDPVSGRKLINHYEIIDELGRGTHGKVKLGRDLSTPNTHVAIKIVERFSKRRKLGRLGTTEDKVKQEVAILKKARHPNIVALLEVIDDPSRLKVYIVLEWVERGEIHWRAKGPKDITMVEARRYEREKSGQYDPRLTAEDAAVVAEAERRLAKLRRQQRRSEQRTLRRMRDEHDGHVAWSIEMSGETDGGEESSDDEDHPSRMSTATTASSPVADTPAPIPQRRSLSRASIARFDSSNSLMRYAGGDDLGAHHAHPFSNPPSASSSAVAVAMGTPPPLLHHPSSRPVTHGLDSVQRPDEQDSYEGGFSPLSRVTSLPGHIQFGTSRPPPFASRFATRPRGHSDGLRSMAREVLDTHLDAELEHVPVMTLAQIRVAIRDTLLGLQYLHYQGIVHRDIKPPNLLATIDNRVKISDFGVSYLGRPVQDGDPNDDMRDAEAQNLDDEARELAKTVGTPAFYAPELCVMEPSNDPLPVTKAIDVWALGITLFCMLFARTPFVDSEFVVMRQIADEEVYIPRKRLQPVSGQPPSRSSSGTRARPSNPFTPEHRHPLELVYEDIDDELYDLLQRLLTKDPRRRITLEEVRHHPWVLADLPQPTKWLEETQPSRQSQGKKIEISSEDFNTALVPLNIVERMRSTVKRIGDKLGLSSKTSGGRLRSTSSAASLRKDASTSLASSSSTLNRDQAPSTPAGTPIDPVAFSSALRASREISSPAFSIAEPHPLAQSVASSPRTTEKPDAPWDARQSSALTPPPQGSAEPSGDEREQPTNRHSGSHHLHGPSSVRPGHLWRRASTQTTAAESAKLRGHRELQRELDMESPMSSPGLPSTPINVPGAGHNPISNALKTTKRIVRRIRESSANRGTDLRRQGSKSDRGSSIDSFDAHGDPSLAMSPALASGRVNLPDALRDYPNMSQTGSSAHHGLPHRHHHQQQPPSMYDTPSSSRPQSIVTSPEHLHPPYAESGDLSRRSSTSSIGSSSRYEPPSRSGNASRSSGRPESRIAPESSAEEWHRANTERIRRRMIEIASASSAPVSPARSQTGDDDNIEFGNPFVAKGHIGPKTLSTSSFASSTMSSPALAGRHAVLPSSRPLSTCPPSPDDEMEDAAYAAESLKMSSSRSRQSGQHKSSTGQSDPGKDNDDHDHSRYASPHPPRKFSFAAVDPVHVVPRRNEAIHGVTADFASRGMQDHPSADETSNSAPALSAHHNAKADLGNNVHAAVSFSDVHDAPWSSTPTEWQRESASSDANHLKLHGAARPGDDDAQAHHRSSEEERDLTLDMDEFDDSSDTDSDGGLVMTRRRSGRQQAKHLVDSSSPASNRGTGDSATTINTTTNPHHSSSPNHSHPQHSDDANLSDNDYDNDNDNAILSPGPASPRVDSKSADMALFMASSDDPSDFPEYAFKRRSASHGTAMQVPVDSPSPTTAAAAAPPVLDHDGDDPE